MKVTFEYNNAFGLNQEEFLQAIIGAFVLQNSFGALSAGMITGDESSVCNNILHRGLIYKSDYRRLKACLYCYVKLAPLQQE